IVMPSRNFWADFVIFCPSATTRPASIAACASARLAAKPWLTRNTSARSLRSVIKCHPGRTRPRGPALSRIVIPDGRVRDDIFLCDHGGGVAFAPQRGKPRRNNRLGVEARNLVHALGRILIDEAIWQDHGANLQPAVEQPVPRREMQHVRAEATD